MAKRSHRDEGVTLIEVLVALLVFALLASGVVAAAGSILRMTGDNRARSTAANLASQDLDVVRAIADPFSVASSTTATAVDGRTYTVARTVSWVSRTGADISCNSSTNLYYLRVNVRVTWPGMLGSTAAVQDDTILSPSARINDSSSGSIAVAVAGADSLPESGIQVVITPKTSSSGKALNNQPKDTGVDGCTYANQVSPGTYTVQVKRTNWISDFTSAPNYVQSATPAKDVTVTAGATSSVQFQFDQAATYTTNYVFGPATYASAYKPTSFETNFVNTTWGTYTTAAPAASVKLYPYPSGYGAFVGKSTSGTATCASVDPQAWTASGALGNGARATPVPAVPGPGGAATLNIPMGVVLVKAPSGYGLGATQGSATGSGNPGCSITGTVYSYSVVTNGGWIAIALPYGSWKIYYGTSTSSAVQVGAASLQAVTNATGGGVASDGTVTLDPRPLK